MSKSKQSNNYKLIIMKGYNIPILFLALCNHILLHSENAAMFFEIHTNIEYFPNPICKYQYSLHFASLQEQIQGQYRFN